MTNTGSSEDKIAQVVGRWIAAGKSKIITVVVAAVCGTAGYYLKELPNRWSMVVDNRDRINIVEQLQVERGEILLRLKGTPDQMAEMSRKIAEIQKTQVEIRISVSAIEGKMDGKPAR